MNGFGQGCNRQQQAVASLDVSDLVTKHPFELLCCQLFSPAVWEAYDRTKQTKHGGGVQRRDFFELRTSSYTKLIADP